MKHMQADKYTIAWFKIAECVSRGEKERALGVYRLLSHSFNDNAVARQLEADIYLACNELDKAIDLYRQAMEFYQKSERFLEAAAVCEHLITLLPNDFLLRSQLVNYYVMQKMVSKIHDSFQIILESYIYYNEWENIAEKIIECEKNSDPFIRAMMFKQIIVTVYQEEHHIDLVMIGVEKAINSFLVEGCEKNLQEFLSFLRAFDQELYEYALNFIKIN